MTGKTNTIVLWVGVVGNKSCPEPSRRDGVNSYVAVSEDALRDEVFEYVKEWWQEDIGDLPIPQDRDRAIEAYFEKVESETFMIDSTTLAGDFEDMFHPLPGDKITGGYGSTSSPQALKSASGIPLRKRIPGRDMLICCWERAARFGRK